MFFDLNKGVCIEFISKLVNKKELLQRVNAAKIDIISREYCILGSMKIKTHYIVQIHNDDCTMISSTIIVGSHREGSQRERLNFP